MKRLFYFIMITVLFSSFLTTTTLAEEPGIVIDGINVTFNNSTGYPFTQNGRTLVPLRVTMESFGAEVLWEEETQTVIVKKGTTTVRLKIGENLIYRNNIKIENDSYAQVLNGRTYLPIRAVLEAFGAEVSWDGNVKVTSPGKDFMIYEIENTSSVTTNYWKIWSQALETKNSGDFSKAIAEIRSISSIFIQKNTGASNAMLYKHLGECYANLKDYQSASSCFKREAYYWSITPGMEQSRIDAERRSNLIKTSAQIYVKSTDKNMGGKLHFGKTFEPEGTVFLGAYAEGDKNIYNPYSPSQFYMDTFPVLVGRDMASYLLYLPYGTDISHYNSHFKYAIAKNKILQIALEPHEGLGIVNATDGYLINLAKNMEKSECKFILRFAGEMNDTTSKWYNPDPSQFIEKFRIVADIFHTYAPSVPVIWAPNFYPSDTIDDYYPGDNYVDYVGISSYMMHQPVTDPLGQGIDRSRWSNQLDKIYSLYGHKKPIIITEGGASYIDYDTYADITEFASRQLYDFYTYLPIKYPNVKMCFIFDYNRERQFFSLSSNPSYLSAYKNSTTSPLYSGSVDNSGYSFDYYEVGNNVKIKAEPTELASYIVTPSNDTAYVNYYINDIYLATSYGIPYNVNVDFTSFKGQKTKITVKAFDGSDIQVMEYSVTANII